MARGGARPGAGRKAGSINKLSAAATAAAAATGQLPHEFLLEVSRGNVKIRVGRTKRKPTFEERIDAAKAAAPYYAPRLAAVVAKVNTPGNPWEELLKFAEGKSRGLPGSHARNAKATDR
jgi:hypothetical protein